MADKELGTLSRYPADSTQSIASGMQSGSGHGRRGVIRLGGPGLRWFFCVLIFFYAQTLSSQKISVPVASPKNTNIEQPVESDPLGRDTPRGTLFGFVRHARREDYVTAKQYLQSSSARDGDTEAQELQEVMDLKFKGGLELLSDKPEGSVTDGLPLDRDRVGTIAGDRPVDLILVRVQDNTSKRMIWLISKETIAEARSLYSEVQPAALVRYLPETLTTNYLFSISAAQWIGWLLSIPGAYYLSWFVIFLLRLLYRIVPEARRARSSKIANFRAPFRYICFVILHAIFFYMLKIPLLYRWYYLRFLLGLFIGGVFWVASKGVNVYLEHSVERFGAWGVEQSSMLVLVSRLIRVCLFLLAIIAIATAVGFDTKAMLTGVGIGGLAIALAGQKTLENVLGGVSLLLDRAVKVGDTCRIGDKLGRVEDVGLRSLRLRMTDQSLIIVPNGVLAQAQFENLTSRSKHLIQNRFSIRSETPVEKLQAMLDSTQEMLDGLPYVERDSSRIRVVRFSGTSTEIELSVYVLTTDWGEFTTRRQEVMIKALQIVEAKGIRLTGPTQFSHAKVGSQWFGYR